MSAHEERLNEERASDENPLEAPDLKDLQASALSPDMISRMGIFSATAAQITEYTGVKKVSAGYGIPYPGVRDQTGEPYVRFRQRNPAKHGKYISGAGEDCELYVPPCFDELPTTQPLIITEGEKKAAKGVQEGFASVGLQGVWCWAESSLRAVEREAGLGLTEDSPILPKLLELCERFTEVMILGDSDLLTKPQAKAGLQILERALLQRDIRVSLAFCPPRAKSASKAGSLQIVKQGLDDWLVNSTPAVVRKALESMSFAAPVVREGSVEAFMAEHFAAAIRRQLVHSEGRGWMSFNGVCWVQDSSNQRLTLVDEYAQRLSACAKKLRATMSPVLTGAGELHEEEAMSAWAKFMEGMITCLTKVSAKLRTRRATENLLTLAQPRLAVQDSVWDRDPHLLSVQNGVVNLRDGQLLPPNPGFYNSHCCNVAYHPAAKHEVWNSYLERVQPNPAIREELQTLAGYLSTGETREQSFFVHFGTGANGKSTFQQTIKEVLGSYATAASTALVDERADGREASHALAELAGRRFALIAELQANTTLASARIKTLTGEECVSARRLYSNLFSFKPSCKLGIETNHTPRIADKTYGFDRRMRVFLWSETISPREMHNGGRLLRKQLEDEAEGILAWIVDGAINYYRSGLRESAEACEERQRRCASADPLQMFIDTELQVVQDGRIQSSVLHAKYNSFRSAVGFVGEVSPQTLSKELENKGYTKKKDDRGCMVWCGLSLRDNPGGADGALNSAGSVDGGHR